MKTVKLMIPVALLMVVSFSISAQNNENKNKVYFEEVDEMPEYPGGKEALFKFISENVQYPENAKKEGVTGKVYVSFVVDKNGSVSDVEIARGVDSELDKEAVRVLKKLEKWKPGKKDGELVKVGFTMPIHFALIDKS
ncbi:MAG: energy transducer TonB [Prolixibacteraceae bacterium]